MAVVMVVLVNQQLIQNKLQKHKHVNFLWNLRMAYKIHLVLLLDLSILMVLRENPTSYNSMVMNHYLLNNNQSTIVTYHHSIYLITKELKLLIIGMMVFHLTEKHKKLVYSTHNQLKQHYVKQLLNQPMMVWHMVMSRKETNLTLNHQKQHYVKQLLKHLMMVLYMVQLIKVFNLILNQLIQQYVKQLLNQQMMVLYMDLLIKEINSTPKQLIQLLDKQQQIHQMME